MAIPSNDILRRAVAALQAGKIDDAEQAFKALLKAEPKHVAALNLLSVVLTQRGKFEEAELYVRRALDEDATSDATFYNYGCILKALRRPEEALQQFNQALAINPGVADSWNNRGTINHELGRYQEAIADFDKTISLSPNGAAAYCNKGKSLAELKLYDPAMRAFDRALSIDGNLVQALVGRGNIFFKLKRYQDALAVYDNALTLRHDSAESWIGRGNALSELRQHAEAFSAYDKALTLNPDLAEAWVGRANIFNERNELSAALAAYERALTLSPSLAVAWLGRGNAFYKGKQYVDALAAYDKALAIEPDLKFVESSRLHVKQYLCDWSNFDRDVSHLLTAYTAHKTLGIPFFNLPLPISAADQFQSTVSYVAEQPSFPAQWRGGRYAHERIRVAYVSSDLWDHPVGRQMAEVFEQHDRSRFEMTAISLGTGQESETGSRIKAAFEHYLDARSLDDQKIADYIREHEIDIAVDLNGFTIGGRQGVFARRPAPVQVNYLGYAGTLGADYYDFILADRTVVPEDQFQFYCEKVVWLPDSYMATESRRRISDRIPSREECGLPENGFVFCCFNAAYKLSPETFVLWMRLLKAVMGSVLWLSNLGEIAKANLRRVAEQAGVPADRLIFATRVDSTADHLVRHQLADLFLDTLPYNAHATAVDALWAGLPVVTCLGETFAGRVAGSLLNAVGLPELITGSLADYEALALKLARDTETLAALKTKLARQRASFPLFDSRRFTRNIEAAYGTMWERYRNGQPPVHFAVDAGA